jgi:NADPH:quinone reductase-like Zn-dependent oxidoreductase
MKAIVWTAYGPPDVLRLREVVKPIPKDNEVLIRVFAAAVSAGDCEQRNLKLPLFLSLPMRVYVGFSKPKRITILGMDLAGEIEEVGKNVRRFNKGDQVFGTTGFLRMGAYAEYICLPEEHPEGALVKKPVNMTYEEAAVVPTGGLEALHFLRKCDIRSGEKILINGAGGTIGTFAIQLAKYFGAEVTGVDNTEKLEMLQSIGADRVIDYAKEDFTQSAETYDVIFDVVGKSPFSGSIKLLNKGGRYLSANPRLSLIIRARLTPLTGDKKVIIGAADQTTKELIFLRDLIEAGELKSVIDRNYRLDEVVDAHRYVETGHKKGHVVLTIDY